MGELSDFTSLDTFSTNTLAITAPVNTNATSKGQLVTNNDDNEYIPSSDYSEDSSDDEYIDKRIKNLDNSFLIWSSNAHNKLKKSYTGNSRATKFKKYGPSGIFTKAAKSSQPITNVFHKSQKAFEDKDEDDEIKDKDDDDELEDKDDDDELKDKDDDDELEDKDDDDTGNENEFENDNFNSKLIKLEEILSEQASLHSVKVVYDKGSYKAKQIRIWAKSWLEHGILPKSLQGCHQKIKSIIDDEDVIEQSIEESKKSISIKTSCVWLKKLGVAPQSIKKGIYFDGHEREDVIEYRKEFLDKMLIYEMFMSTFEGENIEQKDPILLPNEKLHIFITHDECLFYANDDRPIVWAPIGEPPLRKKGQGKSIMVSDFLLEINGRLKLNENEILLYPEIPIEARKFLKPGKNEEGWWTAEHLLDQVINYAIPIFEAKYPNAIGMRQILIERGLWYDGLVGHYQLCKLNIDDITRTDCCMCKILSLEEDFKSQKSQLQEEIKKRGHISAKRYTRENCNYTWSSLQKTIPEALDSISLITIRKFARKSWRYMDIYRKGITGKVAEYAVKKYNSHHHVPDTIYNEFN
ncbi:hypothetical protein C1645_811341 [Glomus cerebriforme]|uniref:Uncharacterized protein n=1 Tax=Glomus cerebriforme TaxID=658196 RepID=A0A397TRK2_9GLOM|nr:hypothetical protein C1645_811341 [Glomus cerebriforme]